MKVILIQDTTEGVYDIVEEYTGVDGLEDAIDDMNSNFSGELAAVIEDGRATSIIIHNDDPRNINTGVDTPADTDYQFTNLSATVNNNGTITLNGQSAIGNWGCQSGTIQYTVTFNGRERVFTDTIGAVADGQLYNQVLDSMTIPGLSIVNGSDIDIDVLVTIKGIDNNTYTIGGNVYIA